MFSEPQSVTISGTAHSLPRVASGDFSGAFQKDDGTVKLDVVHTFGKRTRSTISLAHQKTAADPLIPAQNVPYSMTVRVLVDRPKYGYTVAEQKAVIDGFIAALNASSGANITKLLGGES
jgi:hypothetical protein